MTNMFWLDFETTGLDKDTCHPLEVAAIVTTGDLEELDRYSSVIYQTPEILATMNDFCTKMHTNNGLAAVVPHGHGLLEVEGDLIALLTKHYSIVKWVVLCGNTIGFDRGFIEKHMPKLHKCLHYRTMDVSGFKEFFRHRYDYEMEKGTAAHRALPDVEWSVNEMRHYDQFILDPRGELHK